MIDQVRVELRGGDPTVQWIRLFDSEGEEMLSARPDGHVDVVPGNYRISVKVVARPVLTGNVSIDGAAFLKCKPATMGRIRCTNEAGRARLVLEP